MAALVAIVLSFVLSDDRTLRLLLTSLCLVAALLVAALVVALVNRWRRQRDAEEDVSPNAQLAQYRSLYEAGAISAEEYERLRAVLGAQLRESIGAAKGPTGVSPVPQDRTGETPVPPVTGITPVLPGPTGETPVAPPQSSPPPETGIQRPDGSDTGIRPA